MHRMLAALLMACLLLPGIAVAEKETEQIVLSFAGDCTLGSMKEYERCRSSFITQMAERGLAYPFSGVLSVFEEDDLTLVNLEGTFTEAIAAQDKAFLFRAPPSYAEILPLGSVEAVNIANNHIRDYYEQGREDTMAALSAHGVLYSGEGVLAVVDVGGIRVGMTGHSYPHRRTLEKLAEDIAALTEQGCDIIIFSMHAGTEEQYKMGGEQKDIARGAIDLGADIVVGHHPHVLQGMEIYRGKPIFYSLGNFAFGGNGNPKDWDTMIAQVEITKDEDGIRVSAMRVIPCLVSGAENRSSDFRPVIAEGERAQTILRKLRRYSINIEEAFFETGDWMRIAPETQ